MTSRQISNKRFLSLYEKIFYDQNQIFFNFEGNDAIVHYAMLDNMINVQHESDEKICKTEKK